MVKECIKGNAYNSDIYRNDTYTWQDGEYTVYRTTAYTAPGCHDGCGILYYVKDGNVAKVEGDPNNGYSQGTLCMRCLDMVEALNSDMRVKYPMRRAREDRGKNTWERISWDEAYDIIERRSKEFQGKYGAGTVVVHQGTGRNVTWQAPWLAYAGFRTPNYGSGFLSGDSCYTPRASVMALSLGDFMIAYMSQTHSDRYDSEDWQLPGTVLVWGCNPVVSSADGFLGHWIVEAMKRGSDVVVVDPRCTWLAAKAKHWLQIRPGTDAPVAMAMINTIIEEDLYDHEFVDSWSSGFEELVESVKEWTCEKAAEISWTDAEDIRSAARFIATNGPVAMQWGVAVDMQTSSTPVAMSICDIIALTGSIDVPGGTIVMPGHAFGVALEPFGNPDILKGIIDNCGGEEGYVKQHLGVQHFPFKNTGYFATGSPDMFLESIESDGAKNDCDKFPISMSVYVATDPIANMATEAPRVLEAMRKVEFNVFIDYQLSPSVMAAGDLILPCAMTPERDSIRAWWFPLRSIIKVADYYEAKGDDLITYELCQRLNPDLMARFPTFESWLDSAINAGSLDYGFQGLKERVIDWPEWHYNKYRTTELRGDGGIGFRTQDGRYQFAMQFMKLCELPMTPFFDEPHESPVSTPNLYEEYPLVLTSGRRMYEFFHSEHRNMPTLRASHPDPLVEMNPETARELGIVDGEWVWIENQRGRCRQRAMYNEGIDPRVVMAEHGWWFPEDDPERLYNTFDSNINNLTSQCSLGRTGVGASYKSLLCKVYKCTSDNSMVTPTEQVLDKGGFVYERKHIV